MNSVKSQDIEDRNHPDYIDVSKLENWLKANIAYSLDQSLNFSKKQTKSAVKKNKPKERQSPNKM